ncbi:hypothetical protein V8C44DRAFT_345663 [Trichoderma aethiopicum]
MLGLRDISSVYLGFPSFSSSHGDPLILFVHSANPIAAPVVGAASSCVTAPNGCSGGIQPPFDKYRVLLHFNEIHCGILIYRAGQLPVRGPLALCPIASSKAHFPISVNSRELVGISMIYQRSMPRECRR